jgi:hypothetical protein
VLTVPPNALTELLPLFCRSSSRFVKNDCNAAVPDVAELVAAAPAVEVVAAPVALVAVVLDAGVVADVLPPKALISCVKALLSVEIAFDDKFEPLVLVRI